MSLDQYKFTKFRRQDGRGEPAGAMPAKQGTATAQRLKVRSQRALAFAAFQSHSPGWKPSYSLHLIRGSGVSIPLTDNTGCRG